MRSKGTTLRLCAYCGVTFSPRADLLRIGRGRFCRQACSYASRLRPIADRFWEKVDKAGPPPEHRPDLGNCWNRTGFRNPDGYGEAPREGAIGRRGPAHVVAWELVAGPVIPGLFVCHVCDNPACVRNDTVGTYTVAGADYPRRGHLFMAPHDANLADAASKRRMHEGEANGAARLHDADVRAIRVRYAAGGVTRTCAPSVSGTPLAG